MRCGKVPGRRFLSSILKRGHDRIPPVRDESVRFQRYGIHKTLDGPARFNNDTRSDGHEAVRDEAIAPCIARSASMPVWEILMKKLTPGAESQPPCEHVIRILCGFAVARMHAEVPCGAGRPVLDGSAQRAVFVVRAMTTIPFVVADVLLGRKPALPGRGTRLQTRALASLRRDPIPLRPAQPGIVVPGPTINLFRFVSI
jgi:hypothetical protein